jgi:phospholipid transport system substrate-binding protein
MTVCQGFEMKRTLFGLLTALWLGLALAAEVPPDALARTTTEEVLSILRADKDIQAGNTRKVYDLVEAKILPHFNFARMTRLAVGQPWRQASAAQQEALTTQFRTLLVYTYANALMSYRNQTVEYKPLKLAPEDSEVEVRSLIKQPTGGDPIDVVYSMEKTDKGWKVYDVKIAGVSIVVNYRSNFAAEIQKGGIDGLIATLAAKNKTLGQASQVSKK